MVNKFFSWKIRWKHVAAASCIAALVMFIAGILFWYFLAYLPMSQHLLENQQINAQIQKMQQFYRLKNLPANTSTPSQ
jgi:Sec-independent protein secretion pathway component TatC